MQLKALAREWLPPIVYRGCKSLLRPAGANVLSPLMSEESVHNMRDAAFRSPRHAPGEWRVGSLKLEYTDLLSFFIECKDIFFHRIYHFETAKREPMLVDGGGCLGLATLYWKTLYPRARISCFEPDPDLFGVLLKNLHNNGILDVNAVNAGLARRDGSVAFQADGMDGGRIVGPEVAGTKMIRTVRLSDHLTGPVDFLKLNIEGQELDVLEEAAEADRLRQVRELVVEYHGFPGQPQRLGPLLTLLGTAKVIIFT